MAAIVDKLHQRISHIQKSLPRHISSQTTVPACHQLQKAKQQLLSTENYNAANDDIIT